MSRVLAIARELPHPPNAGDRIVTNGFIRALDRRGHEVHLLAYQRAGDGGAAEALRSRCASVHRVPGAASPLPAPLRKALHAATGRSDVMATFDAPTLRRAAANLIRSRGPDVVLAQHPYIGQVFLDDRVRAALGATGADAVTSAHVVEYAAHRRHRRHADDVRTRAALAAEVPRLRREELAVYDRSDRTLVLGREDGAELDGRVTTTVRRQRVGLDVGAYDPATATFSPGGPTDGPRLVFFGSYDWFPNADAVRYLCERVFPAVRAARADVELVLAGRGADADVRAYGEREGVAFVGEVDDLADLLRGSAAVVAPLRVGGGTRIKVLESMAWGVPVVTTPAGAEGIESTPGDDLVVADGVQQLAAETLRLLRRPDERARLAANARETVERRYSIAAIAGDLERNLGVA